jgi:cell division protein FtsX
MTMKRNYTDTGGLGIDWLGVLFFLWVAIMVGVLIALNASQGDWR